MDYGFKNVKNQDLRLFAGKFLGLEGMESPLKVELVLGTVTTAQPITEGTAAPWGWKPGQGDVVLANLAHG